MNIIGWILLVIVCVDMVLLAVLGLLCLYCDWRERHEKRKAG